MAEDRTTFEVWTWPHNGDPIARKFPITGYVTDYEFSAEYGVGAGDGVLHLDPTFARLTEIINRDYLTPANDNASIIMVCKDGIPYRPYVAARLPKTISSEATSVPLTLRSMAFFLDRSAVAPFDHNPLVIDSANPNPTLDPDWEYGAESVLRFGDSISNEVQQIWRSTGMSSGTFTLKRSDDATETAAIAWDASAGTLQTRVQDDLPGIVDVTVSGDGTDVAPWEFEFLDPSGDIPFTLEIGTNSTNGVFSTDTLREGGSLDPSPWTQSQNPMTKVVHGNYQTFDIVDNTIAPVAAFPAGDTHVLRIDVDSLGEVGTDYGGAQQIVQVDGGSRWRAGCWVYSPTEAKRFRIVVRSMDETTAFNSKDFDVPADTLFFLDMPAINIPAGVSEVIFRIGILEPTNVGVAYIAIQSAILAPGFPPRPWGYIANDLKVDIGFRTSLFDWVTTTWDPVNDSSGVAWDRDLSWTINLRQSLQQLCEISHEWGYESTGIYWSEANSRFEWGCYNPGNGGVDRSGTGFKVGMGDALTFGERVSRVPEVTASWAFGTNQKWGRANNATMVSKWGVLESMALDRQGQDTMDALAGQMVTDSELESAVQKIRIHFARITPGIDFNIGDFINVDMAEAGIVGVFRVAGIVEGKTEDGEEYADVHLGALVKSSAVAQADAVRVMWRRLEVLEGRETGSRVVEPAQTIPTPATGEKGRPIIVAASNAPDSWKAAAEYQCTGTFGSPVDGVTIQQAIDEADDTGGSAHAWIMFSPGDFWVNTDSGSGFILNKSDGGLLQGAGIFATAIHGIAVTDSGPDRFIISLGQRVTVKDMSILDDTFPTNVEVYGINLNDYCTIENLYGYGKNKLLADTGSSSNISITNINCEWNEGLIWVNGGFSINISDCVVSCFSTQTDWAAIHIVNFSFDVKLNNITVLTTSAGASTTIDAIRIFGGNSFSITGCRLRVRAGAGISFESGVAGVSVVGTLFSSSIDAGAGILVRDPVSSSNSVEISVIGCQFLSPLEYGIRAASGDTFLDKATIVGNVFNNIDRAISIESSLTCRKIVISSNAISYATATTDVAAIYVAGISTDRHRAIVISDNILYDFSAQGIFCQEIDGLVVGGNLLYTTVAGATNGISVDDCEVFRVSDNEITYTTDPTATCDAIVVDGTYTRGKVQDNICVPPPTAVDARYGVNPISASGANLIVVGNDLRGTWGTNPINVTNTPIVDYPADATFGDNFT